MTTYLQCQTCARLFTDPNLLDKHSLVCPGRVRIPSQPPTQLFSIQLPSERSTQIQSPPMVAEQHHSSVGAQAENVFIKVGCVDASIIMLSRTHLRLTKNNPRNRQCSRLGSPSYSFDVILMAVIFSENLTNNLLSFSIISSSSLRQLRTLVGWKRSQ